MSGDDTRIVVILKRTFPKDQIMLNVSNALQFVEIEEKGRPMDPFHNIHYYEDQKEIIVKNASKDFKFTAKDIYLYREGKQWKLF